MGNDIRLMNVVAFDAAGNAVIQPLKQWKANWNERRASLEIKCDAYAKTYDLRTQVIAVGVGEATKKVALGKTLGRVALTGLLHGRHAAGADLRWGGVDHDEIREVILMLDDTSAVAMEMDGDEFEDLLKLLPDAAKEDDAQDRAEKLMDRVKAMVADGERVLTELAAKHDRLQAEAAALANEADSAQSFDERHAARERREQVAKQLVELATEQRAVVYDFAVIRATKALKAKNESATPSVLVSVAPPKPLAEAVKATSGAPVAAAKSRSSFMGKLVKLVVWCIGAFFGFFFWIMMFGGGGNGSGLSMVIKLGTFVAMVFGSGWIALKMLAALLRRGR